MTNIFAKISAFLLSFLFVLSSCSDDTPVQPQKPPEKIDTVNKYDWALDTIFGYNCDFIYTADSNNVFIAGYPAPLYYNGETYTELNMMDPLFICGYPAGYDKDNVFFGGGKSGTIYGDPILKKWTNGTVATFTVIGDSGVGIEDILVEGPDECWLSSRERYKIYHFNAGVFTSYDLDSGQRGGVLNRDNAGNLLVFPYKVLNENNYLMSAYKFENDSFRVLRRDTINDNTELSYMISKCGRDMLRQGKHSIFYFNGLQWTKLCSTLDFAPYQMTGISKENFVCYGSSAAGTWQIFVWDGLKWIMEGSKNIYHYYAFGGSYLNSKDTIINIIFNVENGLSLHLKGRRKN